MKPAQYIFLVALFIFATYNGFSQTYLMDNTTVSAAGITGNFYDSGGSGAPYSGGQNYTKTFTNTNGQCLQFNFYSFWTQKGEDLFTIYDGTSTTAPVIGIFSSISAPGTITSTTGSLTFNFISNSNIHKDGWAASITSVSCATAYLLNINASYSLCSGLFYDSGGSTANYSISQNFTQTFTSNSGNCIQAIFYSFGISSGDALYVYDGTTTAAPLITSYTGTTIPNRIVSSSGSLTFNFISDGSGTNTGWTIGLTCTVCPAALAATPTYLSLTTGLQNTYCVANMVNTCSGTIADDGGFTANYSNNIASSTPIGFYRTFCPDVAGNCMRIQFYEIKINGNAFGGKKDKLTVVNAPTQVSLPFPKSNNISGVNCTSYDACMGAGFGPWVAYNESGCISIGFQSNNDGITDAGWKATLDCVPCLNGPNGTDNYDCQNSSLICSNTTLDEGSVGPGLISEAAGCVVAENYTNWYELNIQSSGTLGFTIQPYSIGVSGDDYDFALYGPGSTCGTLGSPIRCSYAWSNVTPNPNNLTGINSTNNLTTDNGAFICGPSNSGSDVSEDVCGNSWVDDLPVTAGETYYLMLNQWYSGGNGFTLTWNLTNGASLACSLLPVTLTSFTCSPESDLIALNWVSQSEYNNDYYELEKSADGENFVEFTQVEGKEYSTTPSQYFVVDNHPFHGDNFYRLSQIDKDGTKEYLQTTTCFYSSLSEEVTLQVFDLSGKLIITTQLLVSEYEIVLRNMSLPVGVYVTAMVYKNGTADLGKYLKM